MNHFMAMGGAYSYALKDYYEHNLTQYLTDPVAGPVFDLEDMFSKSGFSLSALYSIKINKQRIMINNSHILINKHNACYVMILNVLHISTISTMYNIELLET